MLEPPKLANEAIADALERGYGLRVRTLEFLPLGGDAASAVYRVETGDGATLFLKTRTDRHFGPASLLVPHWLHGQGVPHVLSPLATKAGALWVRVDGFALALVPFLDARQASDGGLSQRHWTELGSTVKRMHALRLPPELASAVPRETFAPSQRDAVVRFDGEIATHLRSDPVRAEMAELWRAKRATIRTLVERTDALGRELSGAPPSFVLCHADLHAWNVLVDRSDQLWLVDWDDVIQAPVERLSYYRYAWAVQDIGSYGEQVFCATDPSDVARRAAFAAFAHVFEPGNIVDIALGSEPATRTTTS